MTEVCMTRQFIDFQYRFLAPTCAVDSPLTKPSARNPTQHQIMTTLLIVPPPQGPPHRQHGY